MAIFNSYVSLPKGIVAGGFYLVEPSETHHPISHGAIFGQFLNVGIAQ